MEANRQFEILPSKAKEISAFIARTIEQKPEDPPVEQRSNSRHSMPSSVVIRQLDENGNEIGPGFCTISKDLSDSGLGFLHTDPVTSEYLEVTVVSPIGEELCVNARVCHCTPVGNLGLLYQVGVEFYSRNNES